MPRSMSGGMLTAFAASTLNPAFFVQITFKSGTVYYWTGVGTISWNSQTWQGVGTFGGISTIDEGTTVEAKGISLTLSGIDVGALADVTQQIQTGAPVTVYLGLFDNGSPRSLIPDPVTAWSGRVDQATLDVSASGVTISLACESRLLDMNVAINRRYGQADQAIDFPGDLAFTFVAGCQERQIEWGQFPSANPVFGTLPIT